MKIIYIASSAIPSRTANSVHVMKMCHSMASLGNDVTLVIPDRRELYETEIGDPFTFYGVSENFRIHKLAWRRLKGRAHVFGLQAALFARKAEADLVFCRHLPAAFFCSLSRGRLVFESHVPADSEGRLSAWMFNRLIRGGRLDHLVVITKALANYYRAANSGRALPLLVAPDGADILPDGVNPIELCGRHGHLQIGYVGHLYAGKGMEVVAALAPCCPWVDFHVVGGTPDDVANWRKKCAGLDNLRLHGYVSPGTVPAYLRAFDIALLPNQQVVSPFGGGKGDIGQWTSPLKAFEYMAAGLPIIASDLPILREILRPEENAILCASDDVEAWCTALDRLGSDVQLRARLGRTAREDLEERYSWQNRAANILCVVSR